MKGIKVYVRNDHGATFSVLKPTVTATVLTFFNDEGTCDGKLCVRENPRRDNSFFTPVIIIVTYILSSREHM
jgi:hypothetical protein